jgi:hypothetical protein
MNQEDNQHFVAIELSNINQEISKLKYVEIEEDEPIFACDMIVMNGFTEDPDLGV